MAGKYRLRTRQAGVIPVLAAAEILVAACGSSATDRLGCPYAWESTEMNRTRRAGQRGFAGQCDDHAAGSAAACSCISQPASNSVGFELPVVVMLARSSASSRVVIRAAAFCSASSGRVSHGADSSCVCRSTVL